MSPAAKKSAAKKNRAGKKGAAKKGAAKNGAATRNSKKLITVRMYNVGFGDSFLLMIPARDRTRKILIDCGVHMSGPNPDLSLSDLVKRIVKDVTEDGTPRIDVVIATHRHRDHVHGFREQIWETVEVGEVWMPWTEHPTDPLAKEIRETQSAVAARLDKALEVMIAAPQRFRLSAARAIETKQLREFVSNSLTNAEAMETLHDGFAGGAKIQRRYLPYKERGKNSFDTELLPGVTIHAMGPSRDPEVIRDMNPPKGQSYLRLMDAFDGPDDNLQLPFHQDWSIKPETYDPGHAILKSSEIGRINNMGDGTELSVAVALEDAVNGTSLMLMLHIGKAYLLFPGDAQWGTWNAAMNDPEWRRLLQKTNFYKIGHHGSHNATPKEFVDDVLHENFSAMASVRPIKKFKLIPKKELMEKLREKPGKVVRSDKPDPVDPEGFVRTDYYVETYIQF